MGKQRREEENGVKKGDKTEEKIKKKNGKQIDNRSDLMGLKNDQGVTWQLPDP